jgi:predicted phage tail protein
MGLSMLDYAVLMGGEKVGAKKGHVITFVVGSHLIFVCGWLYGACSSAGASGLIS